jgi:hypothetical protein
MVWVVGIPDVQFDVIEVDMVILSGNSLGQLGHECHLFVRTTRFLIENIVKL